VPARSGRALSRTQNGENRACRLQVVSDGICTSCVRVGSAGLTTHALSLHRASEVDGFQSPIVAQLVHSRSEKDAIELRPEERPNKRSSRQKNARDSKNNAKNSKKSKKQKRQRQFPTPLKYVLIRTFQ
jgi:hypothetical protein